MNDKKEVLKLFVGTCAFTLAFLFLYISSRAFMVGMFMLGFIDNRSELGVDRTMKIVKNLSRNKIIGSGDIIKILFTDAENEEALFVERQECYVIVVHDPGVGKYHLVDLSNGTIVFSIDFDKDICDELNKSFDAWEFVDAELNVSN